MGRVAIKKPKFWDPDTPNILFLEFKDYAFEQQKPNRKLFVKWVK